MSKVNSILTERLKQDSSAPKMAALAKKSVEGNLTSFSGVFGPVELNATEKENLQQILQRYFVKDRDMNADLKFLEMVTSEVKAISNQAAILHGERIKKAQQLLKNYRDGAFTAWLSATYGNRQTPYNFMQYHEFYESMPKSLHPLIEAMPRQAVYTLASREGTFAEKEQIVRSSTGQTKEALLTTIRQVFPLDDTDGRKPNSVESAIQTLRRLSETLADQAPTLNKQQRFTLLNLLEKIKNLL